MPRQRPGPGRWFVEEKAAYQPEMGPQSNCQYDRERCSAPHLGCCGPEVEDIAGRVNGAVVARNPRFSVRSLIQCAGKFPQNPLDLIRGVDPSQDGKAVAVERLMPDDIGCSRENDTAERP